MLMFYLLITIVFLAFCYLSCSINDIPRFLEKYSFYISINLIILTLGKRGISDEG